MIVEFITANRPSVSKVPSGFKQKILAKLQSSTEYTEPSGCKTKYTSDTINAPGLGLAGSGSWKLKYTGLAQGIDGSAVADVIAVLETRPLDEDSAVILVGDAEIALLETAFSDEERLAELFKTAVPNALSDIEAPVELLNRTMLEIDTLIEAERLAKLLRIAEEPLVEAPLLGKAEVRIPEMTLSEAEKVPRLDILAKLFDAVIPELKSDRLARLLEIVIDDVVEARVPETEFDRIGTMLSEADALPESDSLPRLLGIVINGLDVGTDSKRPVEVDVLVMLLGKTPSEIERLAMLIDTIEDPSLGEDDDSAPEAILPEMETLAELSCEALPRERLLLIVPAILLRKAPSEIETLGLLVEASVDTLLGKTASEEDTLLIKMEADETPLLGKTTSEIEILAILIGAVSDPILDRTLSENKALARMVFVKALPEKGVLERLLGVANDPILEMALLDTDALAKLLDATDN